MIALITENCLTSFLDIPMSPVSKGLSLEILSNNTPLNSSTDMPSWIALSARSRLLCLAARSMISFEFLWNCSLASATDFSLTSSRFISLLTSSVIVFTSILESLFLERPTPTAFDWSAGTETTDTSNGVCLTLNIGFSSSVDLTLSMLSIL